MTNFLLFEPKEVSRNQYRCLKLGLTTVEQNSNYRGHGTWKIGQSNMKSRRDFCWLKSFEKSKRSKRTKGTSQHCEGASSLYRRMEWSGPFQQRKRPSPPWFCDVSQIIVKTCMHSAACAVTCMLKGHPTSVPNLSEACLAAHGLDSSIFLSPVHF